MTLPLVVLGVVIALIAVRQVGNLRVQIWQAMGLGALGMLITGSIVPRDALGAIEPDNPPTPRGRRLALAHRVSEGP